MVPSSTTSISGLNAGSQNSPSAIKSSIQSPGPTSISTPYPDNGCGR